MNRIIQNEPRSGIRKISEYAIDTYGYDQDLHFLGYGQPDLSLDTRISDYIQSLHLNSIPYTQNRGDVSLIAAIASSLSLFSVNTDDIFITSGATQAISLLMGCLLNEGDEVLIPDPGYPIYKTLAKHYGAHPVFYSLNKENQFIPSIDEIQEKITNKTRVMVINSPSNPIGSIIDQNTFDSIINISHNKGILVISDEVYDKLIYNDKHYYPFNYASNVISVYSFSKVYNLCGIRIGYIITKNKEVLKLLLSAQEMYASCANYIGQKIARFALESCEDSIPKMLAEYKDRLDLVTKVLGNYIMFQPLSAFYVSIDITQTGSGSMSFCEKILKTKKVVLSPGCAFGDCDHFARMSLIEPCVRLRLACLKIKDFLEEDNVAQR